MLIKAGSSTVKIYQTVDRGKSRFTVSFHEGGRRRLRQFANLGEAKAEAKIIADRLNSGKADALHLNGTDRDSYIHAVRILKPIGVPLSDAASEYAAAKKIDAGISLLDAVKFYVSHHNAKLPSKSVTEVVKEFLTAKEADGRSVRYIQDCRARLNRFAEDFQTDLKQVRTADIDAWLRKLKVAARTRNNFRTAVCSLFSFGRASGYLAKGPTEAEAVALANERGGEIEVFTPEEFSKMLAGTQNSEKPEFANLIKGGRKMRQ